MHPPDPSLDPGADFDYGWYLDHVVSAQELKENPWQTRWRLAAGGVAEDSRVGALALRQGFVVTRGQVRQCGVTDAETRRHVRSGRWHSPGYGAVAVVPAEPETVPALRASAASLARTGHVVSHRSAAALHGLPLVTLPGLAPLGVEMTGARPRSAAGLVVRTARLPAELVTDWYGVPVTTAARTVVDAARISRGQGLVLADAALRLKLVSGSGVIDALRSCGGRFNIAQAREVVALANPLAESPLESLTRLLLADFGFPPPVLQVRIDDPSDGWHARVDQLWPHRRVVLEADGRLKYTREELWREKVRQERLEQLGYRVIRVRWSEVVWTPNATAARIARQLHLP